MDNKYPATREEILAAYPHLTDQWELKSQRMERFRSQGKIAPSKDSDKLATMTNIRAHLKKLFPNQVFSVKPFGHSWIKIYWTKWEPPFGESPDLKQVQEAIKWFKHWPSNATHNEPKADDEFRKLFLRTFGGASSIKAAEVPPTGQQLARKKQRALAGVSRQARPPQKQDKEGPKL